MSQLPASPELEAFCDEGIRLVISRSGKYPTVFNDMRRNQGTKAAITKLMRSGETQSGFKRLKALGLLDWSIEAAVLKFSEEFDQETVDAARYRLKHVQGSRRSTSRYDV
jgi:hypothetical protein